MEQRTLEINIQSAKDLQKVNFITKMDVYVVVSISGGEGGNSKQKTKTPVDKDGDSNPMWNFPVKFTIEEAASQQGRLSLVFKVKCDRALGDKDIGEVHVPIKELLQSPESPDGNMAFVSYQVRKPNGKPKGYLSFGYKFGEKVVKPRHHDDPMMAYPTGGSGKHAVGPSGSVYPPPHPEGSSGPYPPPGKAHAESGAYPPPSAGGGYYNYPAPGQLAHAAPPAGYPYPPPPTSGYAYPQPPPFGGYPPPPAPGYGYPPPPGYGYPPGQYQQQQAPKKNKLGLGLGAGLLGGALGGLLIGDMVSDAAAYDAGFDDAGGFDF